MNTGHQRLSQPHFSYGHRKSAAGFTFLEALIYIGLFSFILGGALLSAYQIFDGTAQIQKMALREAEINFVLRKLDWALGGAVVTSPSLGFSDNTLTVKKDGNEYTFTVDANDTMRIQKNADEPEPLTGDTFNVTAISFDHINDTPDMIDIRMTINGEAIGPIKRYVRNN